MTNEATPTARRDEGRRYADLRASFADIDAGGHLALFARTQETQLRVAAAFVADSLRRNRCCLYLADNNEAEAIRSAFAAVGIDTEARIAAGDLTICPASEVYLDRGFDPDRMVETLEAACHDAVNDGYDGLSVTGENTWCFRTQVDFDRILEFEAAFDACAHDLPATTLCQYDLDRFDERSIAKALWTHEYVVYRETVCRNPYYVAPDEYAESADPSMNAQLMLEQAYRLSRSRQEIERQQQRLSVVSRILRHDIRNDLNVVLGNLDSLRAAVDDDPDAVDRLDTVEHVASRLVDRAEKARYVQRTLADSEMETVDLGDVVDRAVAEVREARPEATITVDAAVTPTVLADRYLGTALIELLTNAADHQTGDELSITLTTAREGDIVTIEVANPGTPIPEGDRRALLQGIETQLEHGGGLGLWLVKWIVDNSHGILRFPEHEDGSHIAIELEVVDG